LNSYCAAADVTALLVGYDLSRIGDDTAVQARLAQLLPVTRQSLDHAVGHDFFWHAGDTVLLDGNWHSRLSLYETGCAPVAAVHAVVVNGVTLDPSLYVVYPQRAEIQLRLVSSYGSGLWPVGCWPASWGPAGRFPPGQQNISVTLDWGYPQVPPEVTLAQAKLTAAQLLAEASGEKLTAAELRLGDYAVRYAAAGQYAAVIQALVQEALALVQSYRRIGMRVV
jgi:hypothetical protein